MLSYCNHKLQSMFLVIHVLGHQNYCMNMKCRKGFKIYTKKIKIWAFGIWHYMYSGCKKKITEHLESFFIVPYIFIHQVKKLTWIFSKTRKHKYFKIFFLVRKMLQYPHALNLLLCCVKFLLLRKLHNKISDFFANIMETNIDILLGFPHLLEIFTLLPLQLTLLSFVFVKDSCGVFPSLCNDWLIESFLLVMYFCQGKQGIAS